MMKSALVIATLSLAGLSACGLVDGKPVQAAKGKITESVSVSREVDTSVAWALNVGGQSYQGVDGVVYEADTNTQGAGLIDEVLGSQDKKMFQSYRSGHLQLAKTLPNGVYDLTLKLAEPAVNGDTSRIFSVVVEGETLLPKVSVVGLRDGRVRSALSRTFPDIEVSDGEFNLDLQGTTGEGLLNGLVLRRKAARAKTPLVWQDEFEQDGDLNETRWSVDVWPSRKVNDEDQAYTARSKNLRVEDGRLIIEAHREDYQGSKYSSGRIHTRNKGDLLYGRVEVRAKLAAGQGAWSAIWMLPTDPFKYASNCRAGDQWQGVRDCDAWPNSGEIDIMEYVAYDAGVVHGTVHTLDYYWVNFQQRKGSVMVDKPSDQFHVYAMDWTPDTLKIYVDDTHYFTYRNEGEGWGAWPFDHPYHLILNLAVGGEWGRAGGPIDDSIFPQRMEVDYVRFYQSPKN